MVLRSARTSSNGQADDAVALLLLAATRNGVRLDFARRFFRADRHTPILRGEFVSGVTGARRQIF